MDPVDVDVNELERRVDRALKQLPAPKAPAGFAQALMRRIEDEDVAPRRLFEWPVALKVALTAGGFAVIVGALLAWPFALEFARTTWQSPAVVLMVKTAAALRPMVPVALMYVTAMCVASAAAASLLKHVALGGASNS